MAKKTKRIDELKFENPTQLEAHIQKQAEYWLNDEIKKALPDLRPTAQSCRLRHHSIRLGAATIDLERMDKSLNRLNHTRPTIQKMVEEIRAAIWRDNIDKYTQREIELWLDPKVNEEPRDEAPPPCPEDAAKASIAREIMPAINPMDREDAIRYLLELIAGSTNMLHLLIGKTANL